MLRALSGEQGLLTASETDYVLENAEKGVPLSCYWDIGSIMLTRVGMDGERMSFCMDG